METKKESLTVNAEGARIESVTHAPGQIYSLIGKAIGKIGAIGKDKTSKDRSGGEQFKYRGIDQVYNALNPVMAELGIFFVPEVLDHKREEKTTRNGAVLTYTIMTMRYTAYAPDGSNIQMTVVGEAMDTGDKSTNKAMSVAMKYAMFQLFCIPTEEMKDPDADVYKDIMPKGYKPEPPAGTQAPQAAPAAAQVNKQATLPLEQRVQQAIDGTKAEQPPEPPKPETPAAFIKRSLDEIKAKNAGFDFMRTRAELIKSGTIEDIPSATMTMEQAKGLITAIEKNLREAS